MPVLAKCLKFQGCLLAFVLTECMCHGTVLCLHTIDVGILGF